MFLSEKFPPIKLSVILIFLLAIVTPAQQSASSIRGQVTDALGGVIQGAVVTLVDAGNVEKTTLTDETGTYTFEGIPAGTYTLRITAAQFAPQTETVEVTANSRAEADIKLTVELEKQKETTVTSNSNSMNVDPENNSGAIVLRESDIEALPDDPDELASTLRALAGPSSGPSGAQIYIDGFTAEGRLPPKSSIKEISINQNPFTAEFEKLGFGRIQITTRPGTSQFHGQGMIHFSDQRFNSRNPFAPVRAPFQLRYYSGLLSGPLSGKRSSFFANFQRREINDNAFVNAIILDPSFNVVSLNEAVRVPRREIFAGVRADYQLSQNHTLLANYTFSPSRISNTGVGNFSLQSRALTLSENPHTIRLTETAILNASVVNETRFQYIHQTREQRGDNSSPTVAVLDSFIGGGAQASLLSFKAKLWEAHNYTTWALGLHTLRFGGRYRSASYTDISTSNFNGTFTFAGVNDFRAGDSGDLSAPRAIGSLERYRRTLLLQSQGVSPEQIRALGGGPTQFSIAGGDPEARTTQRDIGIFLQEDWRMRPNFTLSLGLRYEAQTNISSSLNFAPRVAFAWSPGQSNNGQSKTVIRGGAGVFYDRVSAALTLQSNRFNGISQQQYIVSDPQVLDLFPNAPTLETLRAFAAPQTIRRLADDLTSSYTNQAALSIERQLPFKTTMTATYIYAKALHLLRSRNINAPLPETFLPGNTSLATTPTGDNTNLYAFESSGIFRQHQFIINTSTRVNNKLSMLTTYAWNKAESDTDGVVSFPADTYNLLDEYGRSVLDVRHRLNVTASYDTFWGLNLNTLVIWRTGIPFNITTGNDTNGDTLFTERPALATDLNKPGVLITRFGAFDPFPGAGQGIIPRNYAEGPDFFGVNFGITKSISLGNAPVAAASANQAGRPAAAGAAARPPARPQEKPYKLTFSVRFYNLFNHNNLGTPVGNLSSPIFGLSNTTATDGGTNNATSNRRIWLHASFSF